MILTIIYILAGIVGYLFSGSLASYIYTVRKFAQYRLNGETNVTKLKTHEKDWADNESAVAAFVFGPICLIYYFIRYLCAFPFRIARGAAIATSLAAEKREARQKRLEKQQEAFDAELEALKQQSLKELQDMDSSSRILEIQRVQSSKPEDLRVNLSR